MFWKAKTPQLTRDQSLSAVVVPSPSVHATRDERGLISLEVTLPTTPLIERLSKFLGAGGQAAKRKIELDEVGSFVWEMCDGRTPVHEMIARLAAQYKLNRREAEVSLTTFVKTLAGKGLVAIVVPDLRRETHGCDSEGLRP
jgi:hypothetical protein